MGLVEVAEVAGEEGQVDLVALVEALDRLVDGGYVARQGEPEVAYELHWSLR